jgi:guanylate kinase
MALAPLIIVSGPAGSGKSTLIRAALRDERFRGRLRLAVSATTRPPRKGETDGVEYHFWTEPRFDEARARGELLEHARVHGLDYYGTPRSEVDGYREKGMGVLLDIDVQGAAQVRRLYPDHTSIFIKLPRPELYEERIVKRGSETEETLRRRLETAREELKHAGEYQHTVVNDDKETAIREFCDLIAAAFDRAGAP